MKRHRAGVLNANIRINMAVYILTLAVILLKEAVARRYHILKFNPYKRIAFLLCLKRKACAWHLELNINSSSQ